MKIILTGAAGFIGSCFLRKLNLLGIDHVWVVDAHSNSNHLQNLLNKKFKDYVSREELLERLEKNQFAEADMIVHLGACADTTEMDRDFLDRNNLQYSQTLARWALARGKRFHYASSAAIYGDGKKGYSDALDDTARYAALNPYGESKLSFDKWVIEQKLAGKVVGFRYFNVFGPNEYHKSEMRSMVCKAYEQIEAGGPVKLFATTRPGFPDGSEERDFIYIKDVNEVMAFFLERPEKAGIFNVGTGKVRTFRDLATAVFTAMGRKPEIEYFPMPPELRGQYQYFTQADVTNLRKAGYGKPFMTLEDSVADYVKNYLMKGKAIY